MGNECKMPDSCENSFNIIFKKLDRLDVAIRGNGNTGIQTRLRLLEESSVGPKRFLWLIIGAVIVALMNALVLWIK